jgi:hypothetical protein
MELRNRIDELGEDKQFHVVFYSSGPPVEMPTRRLISATEANRRQAKEFIDGVIPQGETDPSEALKRAFEVKPEVIYLLTDGEFDRAIVGLIGSINKGKDVDVYTIAFLTAMGEEVLKEIAEQNGGKYKYVGEQDLAALVE